MTSENGSQNGRRRVVVTGLGAVTPLGLDVESTWSSLLAGGSGSGEITQFDHTDYPVHFACEVKDFDATDWIDRKQARRMDRFTHLILAAARQAVADAGLEVEKEAERIGASVGTGIGGRSRIGPGRSTRRRTGRGIGPVPGRRTGLGRSIGRRTGHSVGIVDGSQ